MLYLGADHGGFQLKKHLLTLLGTQLKVPFKDMGAYEFVPTDDEPDFAIAVAKEVAKDPKKNIGILICTTGLGVCITANKFKGIRAIIGYNIMAAEMGREHNNANVLCLAGKVLSKEHASAIVKKFLETKYAANEERFVRRNKKIEEIEK